MQVSKDQKFNIICLSNQLWDFENWTNKKHVMSRLMNAGHNVIFVDPPINTGFVFFRHLKRGNWTFNRILTQVKKITKKSIVFTPLNLIPFTRITSLLHVLKIRRLTKKYFDINVPTLLWIYNMEIPYLKTYVKFLKYDELIYDCVDNYPAFPKYDTKIKKNKIIKTENFLIKHSDIVFTTAPGIFERIKKQNKNTFYTPNVGDYEMFKDTKKYKFQLPKDLKDIPEPRIGFIGALDEYKFDFDLFKKVVGEHPNYSFVLIGPLGLKDKDANMDSLGFSRFKNIYYLGSKPYKDKIKYMAGLDVDIIPYVLNDYTVGGCFPVKFHDSLAAGLPVVVTDLPAYHDFKDACYISKSYDSFSRNITRALEEDDVSKIALRKSVAKENSWENKVEKMLQIVKEDLSTQN